MLFIGITKMHTLYCKILVGGNFGEFGEPNTIYQYFTQPNSRFTKVANVSYCKFANIFPRQTLIHQKFYATKILHYTIFENCGHENKDPWIWLHVRKFIMHTVVNNELQLFGIDYNRQVILLQKFTTTIHWKYLEGENIGEFMAIHHIFTLQMS